MLWGAALDAPPSWFSTNLKNISVLLMLPPAGQSAAERWVAGGRLAAARDLVLRIADIYSQPQVAVLAADVGDREVFTHLGATVLEPAAQPFHFGQVLAKIIEENGYERLAYFGGGSAPLLTGDQIQEAFDRIVDAHVPTAVVNNYHSSDWVVLNRAGSLVGLAERLPNDNPLGWVLDHDAGFQVHALSPSAETRCDIDTPMDVAMLHGHPALGLHMREFLQEAPADLYEIITRVRVVLRTPAKMLSLIGRASSHVWRMLEERTQIWTRVFVEERGMIASGRMGRGEVRSIVALMIDTWGPDVFVEHLAQLCDAVLWDTRVWMAHRGPWPSTADRFAADLGFVEQIEDPVLRALTKAIRQASIPILAGGYGVVSGGLYAMLDVIEGQVDHQSARNGCQS
jgi:hypothetical protein